MAGRMRVLWALMAAYPVLVSKYNTLAGAGIYELAIFWPLMLVNSMLLAILFCCGVTLYTKNSYA